MGFLANLFGGGQAKAAKKAAGIQMAGAKRVEGLATDWTKLNLGDLDTALSGALSEFDKGGAALDPYAKAGTSALDSLMSALGLKGQGAADSFLSNFRKSPGYQFQMNEGVNALDRSASARGNLYSGAAGKALTTFGQGQADQEWGSVLDRLTGLVSGGQSAAGGLASISGARADARLGTGQNRVAARQGGLASITEAMNAGTAANAGGIINAANAKSAGLGNLMKLLGGAGKFLLGGGLKLPGMGMGGGFSGAGLY